MQKVRSAPRDGRDLFLWNCPVGQVIKDVVLGRIQLVQPPVLGEDRAVFEADGRDGRLLAEIAVQRGGGGLPKLPLRGAEGGEQAGDDAVLPAAVVQRAAGRDEGGEVEVRGEIDFPQIQVEVPGGQGGGVFLPGEALHRDPEPGLLELPGDLIGGRAFGGIFNIHQQCQGAPLQVQICEDGRVVGQPLGQLLIVKGRDGVDRDGRRRRVPGEDSLRQGIPVDGPGHGPADLRVPAQPLGGVEAQIEQVGRGVVPDLIAAGGAQLTVSGQIHVDQAHLSGIEGGDQLVRFGERRQADLLDREGAGALPPVGAGGEAEASTAVGEQIGAGAKGARPGPQSNGDVQQKGEGAVRLAEGEDHLSLTAPDGLDAGQAAGVPGGGIQRRLEGLGRRLPGEGSAVGEGNSGPEGEGPGEPVLADRVALTQQGDGLELAVHSEEPLVQQRGQGEIGLVPGEDRVKAGCGIGGQGEGGGKLLRSGGAANGVVLRRGGGCGRGGGGSAF